MDHFFFLKKSHKSNLIFNVTYTNFDFGTKGLDGWKLFLVAAVSKI
jgi:hypothetical protein